MENSAPGCPGTDDAAECCSADPPEFCSDIPLRHVIAIGALTTDYREVGETFTYHSDHGVCEQVMTGCCWMMDDLECLACQAGVLPDDYCASEHAASHPDVCLTGEDCCVAGEQPAGCSEVVYPIAMGHGFTGDYREVTSEVVWTGGACHYHDIVCCWWESLDCAACMEQVTPEEFCDLHADEHPMFCGPPVGEQCCVAEPPEWCEGADLIRAIGDGFTTDYTEVGVVFNWEHDTCFEMHTQCCLPLDPHDVGCLACQNNVHPDDFCHEHFLEHPFACVSEVGEYCCLESAPAECSDMPMQRASSLGITHWHHQVRSNFHWNGHACHEEHIVCCHDESDVGCIACQRGLDPDHFCDEHAVEFPELCEGHPSLVPDPVECCRAEPAEGCENAEYLTQMLVGAMTNDHTQVGMTYEWTGEVCIQSSMGCCWDPHQHGCLACQNGIAVEDWCTGEHAAANPELCVTGEDCCVASRPDGCDSMNPPMLRMIGMGITSDYTQVGVTFSWSNNACSELALGCCHDDSRSCSACREGVAADDLCDEHAAEYPQFCIPSEQAPAAVCPEGWAQRGEIGADVGGCGLQSCDQRYDITSEAECAARCDENDDCMGFSYAPMNGDRNHPGVTVCTIYNSDMPNQVWTGTQGIATQVFCGRQPGNIATAGPVVHVLIDRSDSNTKCVTAPVAVICADDGGHFGNRVNSHQAGDTFEITVGGDDRNEVCATRTDSGGGWGMHLEIACVSAPVHILIGNSQENRKCVTHSFPVVCAGDAGHLGNRINSHTAGDTFDITTEGDEVCATRTDVDHGWGMQLEIACVAASDEVIAGQIVAGPPVNILIDNSDTNEKCVDAPYPVICASDAGHLGNRVNTHSADDQFEITTPDSQVCARRLDGTQGWGMHLEVTCVAAPIHVFIGNSDSNSKCVTAPTSVTCADDAGHLGNRVNNHPAGDTFEITSAGSQVCATRTDVDHGWGMQLEIVCVVQPGCAAALFGGGIHASGGADGARAIQFIDLGAGAMQNAGQMASVSYRLARADQAGLKFQVYRPAGGNDYDLIMESAVLDTGGSGTKTVQLATPLDYQAGDYIGWVHTGQGTFNFRNNGGNVRWRYGIQSVGSRINFDGQGPRVYSYEATMVMC